jgi:signal transduction histidine kinase
MLQGAVSDRRLLPTGYLGSMQSDHPSLVELFALSRQIAFISHDLRQPLTAILANAEFLTRPDICDRTSTRSTNWLLPCWSAPRAVTIYGRPREISFTPWSA